MVAVDTTEYKYVAQTRAKADEGARSELTPAAPADAHRNAPTHSPSTTSRNNGVHQECPRNSRCVICRTAGSFVGRPHASTLAGTRFYHARIRHLCTRRGQRSQSPRCARPRPERTFRRAISAGASDPEGAASLGTIPTMRRCRAAACAECGTCPWPGQTVPSRLR